MQLITNRLTLIPISQQYKEQVFQSCTHEVTTYMIPTPAKHIEETKFVIAMMMKQRENRTDNVFAITLSKANEFIGLVGVHHLNKEAPELGVWTKKQVMAIIMEEKRLVE